LNRVPQDAYTINNFFDTDEQIEMAVKPVYGAAWADFQDPWLSLGDKLSGNFYNGTDAFCIFTVTATNSGLINASYSIWTVIAYCNSIIENVQKYAGSNTSEAVRTKVTGEANVWKAMAYFYCVRIWGPVPIVDDNTQMTVDGSYKTAYRIVEEDVYEYIIRLLLKAEPMVPAVNAEGRINKNTVYALLSKVYLTRSGLGRSGDRNQADLDKAREYAGKVVNESGLALAANYADLFTISKGNLNPENLLSWHWIVDAQWGCQNILQANLAVQQLTGTGDGWGTWSGPSIHLQSLFGEDATKFGAGRRVNTDRRRKATMMMDGDYYPELQQSKGGFTITWDGGSVFASGSGAFVRKHIVGSMDDHKREAGYESQFMKTSLSSHLLRLADVYLIYAEAILGNNASTSDPEALKAFNAVRRRAIPSHVDVTEINFIDIFNERRLELSFEGDNWYDFVRLHYYNPALANQLIKSQDRGYYEGNATTETIVHQPSYVNPPDSYYMPFPNADVIINPNLKEPPVRYNFED
jgi:hypothetical protein